MRHSCFKICIREVACVEFAQRLKYLLVFCRYTAMGYVVLVGLLVVASLSTGTSKLEVPYLITSIMMVIINCSGPNSVLLSIRRGLWWWGVGREFCSGLLR